MKSIIKIIGKNIVYLFKSIYWIIYKFRFEDFNNYIQKEEHQKRFIVLANGPSLQNEIIENIDVFLQEDVCVVNNFAITEYYQKIKPKYYVIADPGFWSDLQKCVDYRNKIFQKLLLTSWPCNLFVPYIAFKHVRFKEIFKDNENIKVIPYHSSEWCGIPSLTNWIYTKGLSMPRVQNVVVACIFNAMNMGYKQIDLYGVDHSWTEQICVNEKNEVCTYDRHFYDQTNVELTPWKKFEEQYKMHVLLRDLAYMFESYHKLQEYAQYLGVRIVNHTQKSFIDAFERE